MQTFLPYGDFARSASVLDRQRLGKQRIECLQIATALGDETYGWQNHPAVKMWRCSPEYLIRYGVAICDEWVSRGYRDTCKAKLQAIDLGISDPPFWLGAEELHRSHRSNLLRKAPDHYGPLFEDSLPDDLPYFWPTEPLALGGVQ